MRSVIHVSMAEGAVSKQPDVICSSAIGSCIVIALYETRKRIGGLAHIMLPRIQKKKKHEMPFQCADTGIPALIEWMQREGAEVKYIAAKLVGGARMFSYYQSNPGIGEQNIKCVKQVLKKKGIPLIGEDVGGNYGRSVTFHLDSGKLIIRSGRGKKVI